jgi:hypothetical protein
MLFNVVFSWQINRSCEGIQIHKIIILWLWIVIIHNFWMFCLYWIYTCVQSTISICNGLRWTQFIKILIKKLFFLYAVLNSILEEYSIHLQVMVPCQKHSPNSQFDILLNVYFNPCKYGPCLYCTVYRHQLHIEIPSGVFLEFRTNFVKIESIFSCC